MGLKAVANPAAGGQPGSFTTLTVSGAATIGGGLAVTGSISATGQVGASAFATTGYDASVYSTKLLLAGNSTSDNFATFIVTNGAGRTYYMGPGVGDGQVASFALYDNTSGATRWRSTATGFNVTGLTTTDTLRVNVTPTAEVVVATHTAVFNINGTNYKFLCLAA